MADENQALGEGQATDVEQQNDVDKPDDAAKLKEAIIVETEDVGVLRKKLTITIPSETLAERRDDQFTELKRDSVVPGFRKGHAPLKLVEKRFGAEVGDQILSQIVGGSFLAAVEKEGLKTLGDPLIWVDMPVETADGGRRKELTERLVPIDVALEHMELPDDGAMTFSCEVELRPEFELPNLDGIAVEKPKVEIAKEDVQAEIDRICSIRGRYAPVEGAIEVDDLVVADVRLEIKGDVVKDEHNVSLAARPQRIDGISLENLGDDLNGKKAGDVVTITATVGDDHEHLDYRGETATFTITVQDVKRLELPPLDAELIESLGFDSEDELRAQVQASLESRLESVIQRGMRGQIGKYLIDNITIEVPAGLTQRQTDRLVDRRMVELYQRGMSEQMIHKQLDELRTRASEDAASELKLFFIMEKIAEEMEIEVGDDEMNGEIARIAVQQGKRFDRVRDELSKGDGLTALYLQIRDDKILDELLAKAVVTEIEGPKKKKPAAKKKAAPSTKKSASKTAESEKPESSAKKKKKTD